MAQGLTLDVLPEVFCVCRLGPQDPVPAWASGGAFVSVTRTTDELSVVCEQRAVPEGVRTERDFAALKVRGPLDFALTGILASIAKPLADAGISLFAVSTFDTDYVLVRQAALEAAVRALAGAWHQVTRP